MTRGFYVVRVKTQTLTSFVLSLSKTTVHLIEGSLLTGFDSLIICR